LAIYDAFISYSHSKDKPIASALQSVIQRLGRPWHQRRALRVFRDDTSLSATPQLWPSIEAALAQSRFLILMASPEAAASPWVGKEIAFWLAHKSMDTLLIALTDGQLVWNGGSNDFAWSEATPLPGVLKGKFVAEPKWVDLSAHRAGASARDPKFMELAADFAAAVRGVPKEDLLSEEVRQQRRALTLAWSAVASLFVLMMLAGWQWQVAKAQRDRAERSLTTATGTANSLVSSLAVEFRDRSGMPIDLMRSILQRARNLQKQLTASGEASPALQRSAAIALIEMANTLRNSGALKEGLEAAEDARAIMEGLAARAPGNSGSQLDLAESYVPLGDLLVEAGRRQEALDNYRKALAIREKVIPLNDSDPERRRDLAVTYQRIGNVLVLSGQREQALEALRKALAISATVAADADNPSRQYPDYLRQDLGGQLRQDRSRFGSGRTAPGGACILSKRSGRLREARC
jgi:tetratricopeptide (TPR) repeat protein